MLPRYIEISKFKDGTQHLLLILSDHNVWRSTPIILQMPSLLFDPDKCEPSSWWLRSTIVSASAVLQIPFRTPQLPHGSPQIPSHALCPPMTRSLTLRTNGIEPLHPLLARPFLRRGLLAFTKPSSSLDRHQLPKCPRLPPLSPPSVHNEPHLPRSLDPSPMPVLPGPPVGRYPIRYPGRYLALSPAATQPNKSLT